MRLQLSALAVGLAGCAWSANVGAQIAQPGQTGQTGPTGQTGQTSPASQTAQAASSVVGATSSETIVVLGSGAEQRLFDTPYAASVLDAATLRASGPMVNLSEALTRVPGLVANARNNHAQDLQISSRGFGARASFGVRGMRLVSDGIPASGPDGQGQVSHFDLAGAERVEVLRGPFSALYGASSGGVIALLSRAPSERRLALDVDVGSDGLRQGRVSVAAPFEGGYSLRASASHFEWGGFRPQSDTRRRLGNVRLGWEQAADRVVLVLNAIDQPALDPLGLTRAQLDADPRQTAAVATQFDTRKNTRQEQAGLQWLHRFDAAGVLQRSAVALYSGQRSVTQWQSIAAATQSNPRHPGGVIDFDRGYQGADARLFWQLGAVRAVTGFALDQQQEDRRGFENFMGTGAAQVLGVTGRLRRDEDNRVKARDAYLQLEADLTTDLTAHAGLRSSRLTVRSTDRYLSNGDDSGALDFSATLPVLALRWQPLRQLSLYASAGRGFEVPTLNELAYRGDGAAGFNTGLKPQRSSQWELGAKWRDGAGAVNAINAAGAAGGAGSTGTSPSTVSAELALFEARTRDEIGVLSNSGGRSSFQNVGRSQRRGVELQAQARLAPQWRSSLAVTLLDARYSDNFFTCAGVPCTLVNGLPTLPVPAGNRIAGTVPRSAFAEAVWADGALEVGLEGRAQGRQPVNDVNSDFASGYALLALRALWRTQVAPFGGGFGTPGQLELQLRVDNLADRRVAGSVIVNEGNQRFFEPAAGRTVLLSARWVQRW